MKVFKIIFRLFVAGFLLFMVWRDFNSKPLLIMLLWLYLGHELIILQSEFLAMRDDLRERNKGRLLEELERRLRSKN